VAIVASAGVHLKSDPPFANFNDTSVRLIHRDTPAAIVDLPAAWSGEYRRWEENIGPNGSPAWSS
jgi:hypothetical protein